MRIFAISAFFVSEAKTLFTFFSLLGKSYFVRELNMQFAAFEL